MPVVVLSRPDNSTPWGFRLHGGKDFGSPLTVQRINPGSVASRCGLLIGDVILKIDTTAATDLKHKEAQDLIAKGGNNIQLAISRGDDVVHQKTPDVVNHNFQPSSASTSFSAKLFSPGTSYGQNVEKLTSDTASLNISKKYEPEVQSKWESSSVRGVNVPPTSGYNPGSDSKQYNPSETCKLVRDMDSGNETSYSPRTGAERRPAPVQSKLVDYLDKKCKESTTTYSPPTSSWSSPNSSKQSPYTTTSSGYHSPPATGISPSSVRAAAATKPGGFKSGPTFGAGERKAVPRDDPSVFGGGLPLCHIDNVPVKGPYVMAVNKIWCQEHFVCSNPSCRRSLADEGFVEEDGQLFCKKDYEQYFAPRCSKCDQPIIGDTVRALQKTYHPDCFACQHCKQPIMGGVFHMEQGEPYCEKDWAAFFQSKCFGCQFPIELGDNWIEALGQNWHAECFNCTTCHVNLENQGFVNRGGRPYCKDHARA